MALGEVPVRTNWFSGLDLSESPINFFVPFVADCNYINNEFKIQIKNAITKCLQTLKNTKNVFANGESPCIINETSFELANSSNELIGCSNFVNVKKENKVPA